MSTIWYYDRQKMWIELVFHEEIRKQIPWPDGLVVWFSLWVREVPGSIPGQAHLSFFSYSSFQILFISRIEVSVPLKMIRMSSIRSMKHFYWNLLNVFVLGENNRTYTILLVRRIVYSTECEGLNTWSVCLDKVTLITIITLY